MPENNLFEKVPFSQTQSFIDSIGQKISESVPMRYKGYPTPQKSTSYYDERPVKDSSGNLKMYLVYNISSDTSEILNRFYFYHNKLIQAVLTKSRPHISNEFSIYYFRNDSLYCLNSNSFQCIAEDSIIKLGHLYLLNKDKTSDYRYR